MIGMGASGVKGKLRAASFLVREAVRIVFGKRREWVPTAVGKGGIPTTGIGTQQAHVYAAQQLWESNDIVMVMPTRGKARIEVWRAHDRLSLPMNLKKAKFDVVGMEVGAAYEHLIGMVIDNHLCKGWPWILTYEEDNIPEPDALLKLLVAMRHCPDCRERIGNAEKCSKGHRAWDGVQALYWTKSDPPMPMAYGDPSKGNGNFEVQDVTKYLEATDPLDQLIPVNMATQGFTLYRRSLFEKVSRPWFKTVNPTADSNKVIGQDAYFALKANNEVGARFAVHAGVRCGHVDTETGQVW